MSESLSLNMLVTRNEIFLGLILCVRFSRSAALMTVWITRLQEVVPVSQVDVCI